MAEKRRITIFDTTLRDGAQTPGLAFNQQDRLYIAKGLADVGVDVIEMGFPRGSKKHGINTSLQRIPRTKLGNPPTT